MSAQEKLAFKVYKQTIRPRLHEPVQVASEVARAANTACNLSPVQVVCMHGLLGSKMNFTLVGTDLSHGNNVNVNYITNSTLCDQTYIHGVKCLDYNQNCVRRMRPLPSDYTPQLYQTVAFDWRNHGESDHSAHFSLDGLAVDLARFLYDYSVSQKSTNVTATSASNSSSSSSSSSSCSSSHGTTNGAGAADKNNESCCTDSNGTSKNVESVLKQTSSSSSSSSSDMQQKQEEQATIITKDPIPIVLLAHSMGAMALLHWMWMEHIRIWSYKMLHPENSDLPFTSFSNMHYNVIGAVVLDVSPTERPSSFNQTIKVVHFLQKLPLHEFTSAEEAEKWILQHLPDHLRWLADDIWQIRYHLTNIDFSHKPYPQWKVGINEIADGLHLLIWEHGGLRCVQEISKVLHTINKERAEKELPLIERPPLFDAFPTAFIFGEKSNYNTVRAHANVLSHFASPFVVQMKDADHFFFMRKRDKFISLLHQFMYNITNTKEIPLPSSSFEQEQEST